MRSRFRSDRRGVPVRARPRCAAARSDDVVAAARRVRRRRRCWGCCGRRARTSSAATARRRTATGSASSCRCCWCCWCARAGSGPRPATPSATSCARPLAPPAGLRPLLTASLRVPAWCAAGLRRRPRSMPRSCGCAAPARAGHVRGRRDGARAADRPALDRRAAGRPPEPLAAARLEPPRQRRRHPGHDPRRGRLGVRRGPAGLRRRRPSWRSSRCCRWSSLAALLARLALVNARLYRLALSPRGGRGRCCGPATRSPRCARCWRASTRASCARRSRSRPSGAAAATAGRAWCASGRRCRASWSGSAGRVLLELQVTGEDAMLEREQGAVYAFAARDAGGGLRGALLVFRVAGTVAYLTARDFERAALRAGPAAGRLRLDRRHPQRGLGRPADRAAQPARRHPRARGGDGPRPRRRPLRGAAARHRPLQVGQRPARPRDRRPRAGPHRPHHRRQHPRRGRRRPLRRRGVPRAPARPVARARAGRRRAAARGDRGERPGLRRRQADDDLDRRRLRPGRRRPSDVLDRADRALYRAKNAGRNRVVESPLVAA